MEKKEFIFLLLLITTLLLVVLVMVGYARWTDIRGTFFTDKSSLEATTGRIVSSSVSYQDSTRGGAYYYKIVYEFTVNGNAYSSNQVTFGPTGFSARGDAMRYVAKYPVGAKVIVYYDPSDPKFSVLEPAVNDFSSFLLLGGLLLLPIVAVLAVGFHAKRNSHHTP